MASTQQIQQAILAATQQTEERLDEELERQRNMTKSELEEVRSKRLQAMKAEHEERQKNIANGHGSYEEIADEPSFFQTTKTSKKVVCHFYVESSEMCKILDMHLKKVAAKHVEAKFVKLNAEK
ncbi:hypothetical protein SNEBB_004949, partial [Seison nebaliae]